MKVDGGCHCGAITYEAEVDPDEVFVCHCTDCQRISGSAFRTVVPASGETFRFVTGEPKIYVKTGDSGAERPQAFCRNCGSPIYSTSAGEGPKVYNIRVGTIRQRDQLRPKSQFWYRSAHDWVTDIESMPQQDKE
jgi:hypothetical protein